ncbi:hypothetical protein T439DRAFT_320543 [Meredithblackwellia eburnea MCA 4105]
MFSKLFSLATSARVNPTSWDPGHPVPHGTFSRTDVFKQTINLNSSISLFADGAWSHGTVQFEVAGGSDAGPTFANNPFAPSSSTPVLSPSGEETESLPPTYDAAVNATTFLDNKRRGPQLAEGETWLQVSVEARWNDEALWNDSKVTLIKVNGNDAQLSIITPGMSPGYLGSQLSFHVTFRIPPGLPSLAGLRTTGAQWRTLGHPSLAAIPIGAVSISTSNAPIHFSSLNSTGTSTISTVNSSIEGTYASDNGLVVKTMNAIIGGSYRSSSGACQISTGNTKIFNLHVWALKDVTVISKNGNLSGKFVSREGTLRVESSNGNISGETHGFAGAFVKTSNGAVDITLKTGKIGDVKSSNGECKVAAILLAAPETTTPDLLVDDVPSTSGAGAAGWTESKEVSIKAESSNAAVTVDVLDHPKELELHVAAFTSNAKAEVRHRSPCDGNFQLETSNASAKATAPSDHQILYEVQDKSHATGSITSRRGEGGHSKNRFIAKASNADVAVVVY